MKRDIDPRQLTEAVKAEPDYAEAEAERLRLHDRRMEAEFAYRAASRRMDAIWDRVAERLYGPPPSKSEA